jgi:hypothetical protein
MNKFQIFFEQYSQEADPKVQREMLVKFMLSLKPDELKDFTLGNIQALKDDAKDNSLTAKEKKQLTAILTKGLVQLKEARNSKV